MATRRRERRARIALADGTIFEGRAIGAPGVTAGEIVFTTTTSGYQEVLTDPSYAGQIITLTFPEIGNVGVNAFDLESNTLTPLASGLVVRSESPLASNYRSEMTLAAYLEKHGIVALADIDTRRLTRTIRDRGAQNAAMGEASAEELVEAARKHPSMQGLDLVRQVTPKERYTFDASSAPWSSPTPVRDLPSPHVVVMDFGIKRSILRCLVDAGCQVTAVPARTSAADILELAPDGIFLSNGPGDPAALDDIVAAVRELLGKRPVFGICLGHQLLSRAIGASTYKLKFGHRGANQPVVDLETRRVEITSQNHGFCVDLSTLPKDARPSHTHLNDETSEGIRVPDARAFSVQYHPESAAGPHDSLYLFEQFYTLMTESA